MVHNQLESTLNNSLKRGDNHKGIIELQRTLINLGFGDFKVSRNYGPITQATVEKFQEYYGLIVNGIAEPKTLAKLDDIKIGDSSVEIKAMIILSYRKD